jgi:hypothetical protein
MIMKPDLLFAGLWIDDTVAIGDSDSDSWDNLTSDLRLMIFKNLTAYVITIPTVIFVLQFAC